MVYDREVTIDERERERERANEMRNGMGKGGEEVDEC